MPKLKTRKAVSKRVSVRSLLRLREVTESQQLLILLT